MVDAAPGVASEELVALPVGLGIALLASEVAKAEELAALLDALRGPLLDALVNVSEAVEFSNVAEKLLLGAGVVVVRNPEEVVAPLSDKLPVAELSAAGLVEANEVETTLLVQFGAHSVTVTVAVALVTVSVVVTVTTPGHGGHVPEASTQNHQHKLFNPTAH